MDLSTRLCYFFITSFFFECPSSATLTDFFETGHWKALKIRRCSLETLTPSFVKSRQARFIQVYFIIYYNSLFTSEIVLSLYQNFFKSFKTSYRRYHHYTNNTYSNIIQIYANQLERVGKNNINWNILNIKYI